MEDVILSKNEDGTYKNKKSGLMSKVTEELHGKDPHARNANLMKHFLYNAHTYCAINSKLRYHRSAALRYRL